MNEETPKPKTRMIACPGCKRNVLYDLTNPFRPYCSARCKEIDIAAWATESYRIPVAATESGEEDKLNMEENESDPDRRGARD